MFTHVSPKRLNMVCRSMPLRLALFLGLAAADVACAPKLVAQADGAPAALQSDPVFKSWKNQPSVAGCASCHYQGGNEFSGDDATRFSRLNELREWLQRDKHAIARRRVEPLSSQELLEQAVPIAEELGGAVPEDWLGASNVLSKRICDKLGYEVSTTEGYRRFRENCLTCHGGYQGDGGEEERSGFDRPTPLDPLASQPGISCNYCHQEGDNSEWIAKHGIPTAATTWRTLPPEEKRSFGMRNLVQPAQQASLCFDCHIGNRDQGQFVTHEMYAAGHPPLPSIELQTFSDQMPRHWRPLSDLHESLAGTETRDEYFTVNFPELLANAKKVDAGGMYWNTRSMLIGAIAARVKMLDVVTDSAAADRWADYSLYDCAACHHELREPSLRQQRGYPGAPGRPRQHEWPEPLLTTALRFARLQTPTQALEKELEAQFAKQPFGLPGDVVPVANRLQTSLEAAIQAARGIPVDADMARRILISLAQTPGEQLVTYDSARQVAWAMRLVAGELAAEGSPLDAETGALIASLDQPEPGAESTGIATTLPAGRQVFIYPENLQADLHRRAEFDPEVFIRRLRQVGQALVALRPASAETVTTK